ncbi:porin [Thiomicrorhabdus sp.]|uniref:porin n=1 Tax=Thiomicrorhabdus sp. TaxID=2039724 RepID=UPI0035694E21
MKKNVIALAIASAIAAPVAMADAPTVYGQVNVAIDSVNDNGMFTKDRDSRIGVKGSEDLGNGLKAVYKMEFGVKVGDAMSSLSGRNAYVGLAGGFGTVLLGRHDTPFKMSQAKDLFGDSSYGDIGKKTVAGGLGMGGKAGEVRADNVVAYVSPEFAGIKIVAAGVSTEGASLDGTGTDTVDASKSSLANVYSVAAMYGSTKKGLYLSAAYNSWGEAATDGKDYSETRVSAQYATGGLIASAMFQTFDDGANTDSSTEGDNIQAQVGYKMGNIMPKAKYSTVDYKDARKTASAFGLGLDYSFGKKTTGYVEYITADKYMTGAAGNDSTDPQATTAISVGMVHKF